MQSKSSISKFSAPNANNKIQKKENTTSDTKDVKKLNVQVLLSIDPVNKEVYLPFIGTDPEQCDRLYEIIENGTKKSEDVYSHVKLCRSVLVPQNYDTKKQIRIHVLGLIEVTENEPTVNSDKPRYESNLKLFSVYTIGYNKKYAAFRNYVHIKYPGLCKETDSLGAMISKLENNHDVFILYDSILLNWIDTAEMCLMAGCNAEKMIVTLKEGIINPKLFSHVKVSLRTNPIEDTDQGNHSEEF
jgi:hypothetical protein